MTSGNDLGLLFLHALPLDGSMWAGQSHLLPGSTYRPTLYSFGDTIEAWAFAALEQVKEPRILVVGCSVGGSCALEVAALAPGRIAALVLIGTKARHRPDPALHASALETLGSRGPEAAWSAFWAPLFSKTAPASVIDDAKRIFLRQSPEDLARGVTVFHSRPSRDEVLSTLAVPIIVISGGEDVAPGPGTSAAQASAAQQGQFHLIPDCGHYVPLEQPEALNAILCDVIAALGGPVIPSEAESDEPC